MPLWDHLFHKTDRTAGNKDGSEAEQIAAEARQELAEGVDPHHGPAIGEMLGWLWNLDLSKAKLLVTALALPDLELHWLSSLTADSPQFRSAIPAAPEERYRVVAEALSHFIVGHIVPDVSPQGPVETIHSRIGGLSEAVSMIGRLRMAEAHEAICRLLMAVNRSAIVLRNAAAYQPLQDAILNCLLALPPDRSPLFWAMVAAPATERHFYSIVARIRDPRAVPFLLEALPRMSADAQGYAIEALRNIKDARAVPALQEIAADPQNLLAPIAAQALKEILRGSRDDAAQLLRPTDSRHAGNAGDTLLRPAAATDTTTRPDELLRPGS